MGKKDRGDEIVKGLEDCLNERCKLLGELTSGKISAAQHKTKSKEIAKRERALRRELKDLLPKK